uniref:TF-B3 domain-containing protein n=1 Tax=Solanum lycopersicum TaxID=4081 RepID=A0A3Q7JMK1_SOLLC
MILNSNIFCIQRIPPVFAESHCKDMLNHVFLQAPHGKAWEVEVEHSQGQIWLAKGWKEFSNLYAISVKQLLMFTYNARDLLDVTIFGMDTVEIKYPIQDTESYDSMDIFYHSTENLSHGPLVAKIIQKRQEGEEKDDIRLNLQTDANVIEGEEEYIPVNLQINANIIEEEEEDIPVNLQTSANELAEEESQDQEVEEDNHRSEEVGQKNNNRHSVVNLADDTPYFEIVIKKTHTTYLTIPIRFANRTNIVNMKNMRLVNGEGIRWGVEIEYTKCRAIIKKGWTEDGEWK